MEIWKPILRFETLYEISNLGNVRRIARGKLFSPAQIVAAKAMLAEGAPLAKVAGFLGTSITTAFNIKHEKTWAGDPAYRPIKTSAGTDHYIRFSACRGGAYTKIAIHRAIWEAFVSPIADKMEVNHKNLDRADNRLENLEVLTHSENIAHAHAIYAAERTHLAKGSRGGPKSKYAKLAHDQ